VQGLEDISLLILLHILGMSIVPHNLPHLGWTGLVNMYDVIAAAGAEQLKKDETTWLRSRETDSGKTDQVQT
jgi:hypothetical protein